jgi:hypothetical protein
MNSEVAHSTATDSSIVDSTVLNSDFSFCTVERSYLDNVVGYQCTILDSTVTDSTVNDSTVQDGSTVTGSTITDGSTVTNSTITDSTLINSTVTDSTVINSTLIDMIVNDAWIEDGVIYNGTISDDFFYNATEDGPANLTDVVNYPPVAVISASATSGTATLTVNFDASGSSDPNVPGPLNDSLTYSWDFNAADGITADATGVTTSHAFGQGTFVVTLTVTDSFGRMATDTVTISVSAGGSGGSTGGGGGGGGGGGSSSNIYILVLTEENPIKSLSLRTGDTVKYTYGGQDFSFMFRYVYSDKAKMGVSQSTSYKEYTLEENKKYNLNLDDKPESDLGVTPSGLYLGRGNFTFELLNLPDRQKPLVLPVGSVKRTVSADEASAELDAEPEEVEPVEEEAFSEGVLEFIESMSVKSAAPIWAGVGLALLIILVGLGLYFLVVRKED